MHNNTAIAIPPFRAWMMATRPKTLTTAIIPMLLGTILATRSIATIQWELLWFGIASAVCIQIGTNLINDALDFKKGSDTATRIGPKRVTQSGLLSMQQVFTVGILFFITALLLCIPLIQQGGWPIFVAMLISVLCGYLYTGGPLPLSYCGLGDPFVLIFYGFVAPSIMYYVQAGAMDSSVFLAGTQTGLLAVALIAINNYRDHIDDAKANKLTLAVRFGKRFARLEITAAILIPFILNISWISYDAWLAAFLPIMTLPLGIIVINYMWKHDPTPALNRYFGFAGLLHLTFGLLLCLGLYLS